MACYRVPYDAMGDADVTDITPETDLSEEHVAARRRMRALLLTLRAPNAEEVKDAYYTAITLAEHEAARGARAEVVAM